MDKGGKFGTLVLVQKPLPLIYGNGPDCVSIQVGRTVFEFAIKSTWRLLPLCFSGDNDIVKSHPRVTQSSITENSNQINGIRGRSSRLDRNIDSSGQQNGNNGNQEIPGFDDDDLNQILSEVDEDDNYPLPPNPNVVVQNVNVEVQNVPVQNDFDRASLSDQNQVEDDDNINFSDGEPEEREPEEVAPPEQPEIERQDFNLPGIPNNVEEDPKDEIAN